MMRVDYKLAVGDVISYGVTEIDFDALRVVLEGKRGSLVVSKVEPFTWLKVATIRPWSTWNIPATRCQRIKGAK